MTKGASILAAIEADFNDHKMSKVEVPEWGGLTIFFDPLTLAEQRSITAGHGEDQAAIAVSALLEKAKDKDGNPLFEGTAAERATLESKARATIVKRIMKAMGLTDEEDANDAKKP